MQEITFCSDFLTYEELGNLKSLMAAKSLNFVERALQLGLDPYRDFRYSDLVGCDFTECDIRGFDSTGADLSYSFGLGIIWDETTKIDPLQVEGSFLATEVDLRRQQKANPQWETEYQRISKEDDSLSLDYVKTMFGRSADHAREKAFFMLRRMYFGAKNPVIRNNMLYCASAYAKGSEETRDFLKYLIANPLTSQMSFRSAVRVLSETFYDDKSTNAIFTACLSSADDQVRLAALKGLIRGPEFPENSAQLCQKLARDNNIEIRKTLLKAVCARKQVLEFVTRDTQIIDYHEPQDYNRMMNIALTAATTILQARLRKEGMRDYHLVKATNAEVGIALKTVYSVLSTLKEVGFPFVLERLRFAEMTLPTGVRTFRVIK